MIKTSFIIIAYNEERTIGRCLDAILAQENLADYEIIVVDDGSKDGTAQIVEEYTKNNSQIILHKLTSNQGRGAARATGVKIAQGKYIAFIDADIVLPDNWLSTCMGFMEEYDAVGGIAVPDGDVNYLYSLLDLKPKTAKPTTIVAGSNGFYKKEMFEDISFDKDLRDGEDSVFNKKMISKGFKIHSIKSLVVEHKEARGFPEALRWLYQTGKGATRQLKQFKEIRLPDLAYFGLVGLFALSIAASLYFKTFFPLLFSILYIFLVAIVHIQKKFYFEFRRPFRYLAGIVIYWPLLACYFAGRTAGWFAPVPEMRRKKKIMICFDLEGKLGMPFQTEYDIEKTTDKILDVLSKYNVKAVFFTVGKLIEEYPDLIKKIAWQGHEIGIHGYEHEHFENISQEKIAIFSENLSRVESSLEKLIGKRATGFRFPYLLEPLFYSPTLYKVLSSHGYLWTSNREIRYPDELFRPDRINIKYFVGKNNCFTRMLSLALNIRLIFAEQINGKKGLVGILSNIKWLSAGAAPFKRHSILEIPVHTPLDCDLLGLPRPNKNTSDDTIQYAIDSLISGIKKEGPLYSITFHDWIIGTGNRIQILDGVLDAISKKENTVFITSPEKNS